MSGITEITNGSARWAKAGYLQMYRASTRSEYVAEN
jgi:hypothetical protein